MLHRVFNSLQCSFLIFYENRSALAQGWPVNCFYTKQTQLLYSNMLSLKNINTRKKFNCIFLLEALVESRI